MATSIHDIEINCDEARKQAASLAKEATNCRDVAGKLKTESSKLASCWVGSSASEYLARVDKQLEKLYKAADKLDDLAAAIRQTADIYERKETAKIREAEKAKKAASRTASGGGGGKNASGSGGGGGSTW